MEDITEQAVNQIMAGLLQEHYVVIYPGTEDVPYRKELFASLLLAFEFSEANYGVIHKVTIAGGFHPIEVLPNRN